MPLQVLDPTAAEEEEEKQGPKALKQQVASLRSSSGNRNSEGGSRMAVCIGNGDGPGAFNLETRPSFLTGSGSQGTRCTVNVAFQQTASLDVQLWNKAMEHCSNSCVVKFSTKQYMGHQWFQRR